ncbi:MAG: hypothetical protein ACOH5I_09145 [Oligoflexus sp.]
MKQNKHAGLSSSLLAIIFAWAWTDTLLAQPHLSWLDNLENARNPYHVVGGSNRGPAISHDGRIVVGATTRVFESLYLHEKEPFLADNGVILGLGMPSSLYFDVLNIQVCGDGNTIYGQFLGGVNHPFRWTMQSGFQIIDYQVVACSADGSIIAGQAFLKKASVRYSQEDGEILLDELIPGDFSSSVVTGMSVAGDIIVGNILNEEGQVINGYLWSQQEGARIVSLFPGEATEVKGISGDGTSIFGTTQLRDGDLYQAIGFVWKIGEDLIRFTPNTSTEWHMPYYASFDGSIIVGDYLVSKNHMILNEPFIWTRPQGRRLFRDFLAQDYQLTIADKKLDAIQGLAADGQIFVGSQLDYAVYDDFQGWAVHLETKKTDLAVETSAWQRLDPGDETELEVSVSNLAREAASGVHLISTVPQFLQITHISAEGDICQQVFQGIRCQLDQVTANETFALRIGLKALAPGKGSLQVIASADQLDSNNKNNRRNLLVEVAGIASSVNILLPQPEKPENER